MKFLAPELYSLAHARLELFADFFFTLYFSVNHARRSQWKADLVSLPIILLHHEVYASSWPLS